MTSTLSHRVAVIGYVYHGGRFLLLHRSTPPRIWAPPGGHLWEHEDPRSGVVREVLEETGLEASVLGLVDIWFGELTPGRPLLSLDFLISVSSTRVSLSSEHSEYGWHSLEELASGGLLDGGGSPAFKVADFQAAAELERRLKARN